MSQLEAQIDRLKDMVTSLEEVARRMRELADMFAAWLAHDDEMEIFSPPPPQIEELRVFITQVCKDPTVENCSTAEQLIDSLAADEESKALRRQNVEDRLEQFNKNLSNLAADLDDVATGISENLR